MGTEGLKALRAVLPAETQVYMVGGVGPENFGDWLRAGANGFGLGIVALQTGHGLSEIAAKAKASGRRMGSLPAVSDIYDDTPCELGEGPLWHPTREQLFWFDILGRRILTREGGKTRQVQFERICLGRWLGQRQRIADRQRKRG